MYMIFNSLYPGRYEIECGTAAFETPFQSISTCVRMKMAVSFLKLFLDVKS